MKEMRKSLLFLSFCLLCACGPRGGKAVSDAPARREFPQVEIPSMYTEPTERTSYALNHFWDHFTDTSRVYACDSLTVNGVAMEALDSQMGLFTTLLQQMPLEEAGKAVVRLYDRAESFERKYPESNVFEQLSRLTNHYLYDPNSPVRNEDLYWYYVDRLGKSDLIDSGYRMGYEWDARNCRKNRVGTPAADFSFTDTNGRIRTLYGVKAEYTVLIFGNPGCNACQEIMAAMSSSPDISALIDAGRLKVVDVYIDQEVDDWKAHIDEYPKNWINGYDHGYTIRTDLVYNVRGIPSVYLLDKDKTVLMKDAPQEQVLGALENL
jgi:Uncharacterized protein SCO1/SenC/PrrC, involved in biogenesis of respiratory and photosynthetic systems